MPVLYITSGKRGLHAFTFKELELLESHGVEFIIGFSQLNQGAFMPKDSWRYYVVSIPGLLKGLLALFLGNPKLLINLLTNSLKHKSVITVLAGLSLCGHRDVRRVDHVHCQIADHKLNMAYTMAKVLKVKYSTTLHAKELYRIYEERGENLRFLYDQCDKIFTISNYNIEQIQAKFNIPREKLELMYLYPTNFNEDILSKKKILIVANWYRKKGYNFLLDALARLKHSRTDFVLWIVGAKSNDPDSIDVDQLVTKADLEREVVIYGPQPKKIVDVLMYACDIFCLPSITNFSEDGAVYDKEGIPVALMEAMKWGKLVISTKHAGIPELVPDKFLVEENDVEALVSLLARMMNMVDAEKDVVAAENDVGKKNRAIVDEKFSEKNISSLVDYLQNNYHR